MRAFLMEIIYMITYLEYIYITKQYLLGLQRMMKSVLRYKLVFLTLIFGPSLCGQSNLLTYDVDMILPEELSAFTYINDIKEDPEGYLWLASYKGLSCYNGHQLIHYNNRNKEDSIFLSEEGTGYLHLNTDDNGLHLWTLENETGNVICFNTKTRKIVNYIRKDEDVYRIAYAGENENGIYALRKASKDSDLMIYCLNREDVDTLFLDIKEDIYSYKIIDGIHHITTSVKQKLYKVDTKSNIDSLHNKSLFQDISRRTGLDNDYDVLKIYEREVWLTNRSHGLQIWFPEEQRIEDYTAIINDLATTNAPKTLRGNLFSIIKTKDGSILLLSENSIFRLKVRLPNEAEFFEPIYSGKPITSMRQITEDDEGNIYASYYTGVAKKRKGSENFTDFRDTRTIPHAKEATYSLTYHKDLLIWNTTAYNLKTGVQSAVGIDKIGEHVNHVLEQDTLWVFVWYTNHWIKYVVPTAETTFNKDQLFDTPVIASAMELDKNGHFWFANDQGGIKVMSKSGELVKEFTPGQLGLNYKDDFLYGLHVGEEKVYIATQVGLIVLDIKTEEPNLYHIPYAGENGQLVQRRIYSILPNDLGQFYLGTDHGLVFFDPNLITFRELEIGHPLASKEFNRNSAFKAADGRYYLGTVDGLYSFLPEKLVFQVDQSDIPKPAIYHLKVFNENINKHRTIISDWPNRLKEKLKASDKNIILEYSSPVQNTVWYSHRVMGLQEQWSTYSTEGKLDIYSLPPGDFTIELKALKSPLDKTEIITQLRIHKPQYWYLRWWAIGLYISALIALVAWLVKNRFQRKLEQQKAVQLLRTKISSDLHDDVGSLLGGLAIQSDLMSNVVPETYKAKLVEMSTTSRDAMDLMRDIVWALDSRKDKYENLIDRMRVFAENTLRRKNIAYDFNVEDIQGDTTISPEIRQNVYLIFKEAITNIAKHSDGNHVKILFQKYEHKFELMIQDNGSGKNARLKSDGQGISNMKMRAEHISGVIHFNKEAGFSVRLLF